MKRKNIHQIFLDIGKGSIDTVADGRFKQSKEMTRQYCNKHGYKYCFWTEESIYQLLSKIPYEYLNFYKNLRHPIQKIDFTKYLVLYFFGGIYLDLDINILPNKSIGHLFNINPLIVRWDNSNLPYNAILGCHKKSPVFLEIIKQCQLDYEEKSKRGVASSSHAYPAYDYDGSCDGRGGPTLIQSHCTDFYDVCRSAVFNRSMF